MSSGSHFKPASRYTPRPIAQPNGVSKAPAFTLIELLLVIAVITVLATLLLPALSRAKLKSQSAVCLNNTRQLSLAWILYAGDHDDLIVPNWPDARAWIDFTIGSEHNLPGATNVAAIKNGLLFPYNRSLGIYACPAATRGPARIVNVRLVRHYSLQGRMGGASVADQVKYGIAANSEWLLGPAYPQYARLAEIRNPPPSEAMTFVDESIETLDDGFFAVNATDKIDVWQNSPTIRHGNSGVFGFADGHSERWHWLALHVEQGLDAALTFYGSDTGPDLRRVQHAVFRP